MFKSDLDHWLEDDVKNNTKYAMVGLFNLAEDPGETVNLAYDKPDLVRELLAEAEDIIKHAPKQITPLVRTNNIGLWLF